MNRTPIDLESAILIAQGLLMALCHVHSSKSVDGEEYRKIHDGAWRHFTDSTGWAYDQFESELMRRIG